MWGDDSFFEPDEIRPEEIAEFCRKWREHLRILEGQVRPDFLKLALEKVQPQNFGKGIGQLRPDRELARYDLHYHLTPVQGIDDVLRICMLGQHWVRI